MTSQPYDDAQAILLTERSFRIGSLRVDSYARPGKLFTAHCNLLVTDVGRLTNQALVPIVESVVAIMRSGLKL